MIGYQVLVSLLQFRTFQRFLLFSQFVAESSTQVY